MKARRPQHLPVPPLGFRYYTSEVAILGDPELLPYRHLVLRAWQEMGLTGALTLNGIPTVYIRDDKKRLAPDEAARVHGQFWNQCVATVLLLRDQQTVRVFSSMTSPLNPAAADEEKLNSRLVETIELAVQASWAERFYLQLGTGRYYSGENAPKFDPHQSVDAYLIDNLKAVRDALTEPTKSRPPLTPSVTHSFLGRLLFTCYLCDRGIIELSEYFPGQQWHSIRDLLAGMPADEARKALYDILFPALKNDFNSSMFDDDLSAERSLIRSEHLRAIYQFLDGAEVRSGQRSLGFWAYDFKLIPVETISAIYENFLEKEGGPEKRKSGAYYTPRFLARPQ